MLVVFSPIFVVHTKKIFQYDFLAPLKERFLQKRETLSTYEGVHFLVKLRAVDHWYISAFLQFLR